MRHGNKVNHLGRKAPHRKAMLSNMACSLIEHKRIRTTLAKAKALRPFIEPLITKAKNDTTHSRRVVFSYLKNKETLKELFGEVAVRVADRPGGYTRILKLGNRPGDNAEMALIELVDFNEFGYGAGKEQAGGGKRRRRRGAGKKSGETTQPQAKKGTPAAPEVEFEEVESPKSVAPEQVEAEMEETEVEDSIESGSEEEKKEE